jgi:hypothetical protein
MQPGQYQGSRSGWHTIPAAAMARRPQAYCLDWKVEATVEGSIPVATLCRLNSRRNAAIAIPRKPSWTAYVSSRGRWPTVSIRRPPANSSRIVNSSPSKRGTSSLGKQYSAEAGFQGLLSLTRRLQLLMLGLDLLYLRFAEGRQKALAAFSPALGAGSAESRGSLGSSLA